MNHHLRTEKADSNVLHSKGKVKQKVLHRTENAEPIVLLIDGECSLCHTITKFVVKRDTDKRFRFASIQSQVGQALLLQRRLPQNDLNTFVMMTSYATFTKSEAALHVLRHLGSFWAPFYGFKVVPTFIRDWVYDQVAGHRHRWFRKDKTCLVPSKELRERFIEHGDQIGWEVKE
ncbi:thiol-disulfide oxidoreductase DCC family protein [Paenibacillus solisilvae]|uniref:Thiol-disulfide oxidoreductase DCC family protein n=1 Tax=Paenibacillus solisilvae TaxID=2486751 RepID=A0ABW0VXE0_9BACL